MIRATVVASASILSLVATAPCGADEPSRLKERFAPGYHYHVSSRVDLSGTLTLPGDKATGEAYTLAHHLTIDGETRQLMIAALRYYDSFVKVDGAWLFAERLLYVDWIEERDLS